MNFFSRVSILAGVAVLSATSLADPIKRINSPAPSPDGKQVAFSWQGDIWTVGRDGGRATRLTIHPSLDFDPKWTPDGKIVFTTARYGSGDLMIMDADGTNMRRLSYDGGTEIATGISPDGKYIYGHTSDFSRQDLFRLKIEGGDVVRLTDHPFEREFQAVVSPDGTKVLYCRGSYGTRSWQKAGMQSAALPDIWIADNTVPLTNHKNITNSEWTEMSPQFGVGGTVVFVSNRNGSPNIWKMNLNGSGAKQLTQLTGGTARNLNVSADGKTATFEYESEIYILDVASGACRKMDVDVPADQRLNPVFDLTLTTGVDDYAASPDGKRMVVAVRGDLYVLPERGGTTKKITDNPGMDISPVWVDAKTLLYERAGENGKRELWTWSTDGTSKVWASNPTQDVGNPTVSPDGKQVAYLVGGSAIVVASANGTGAKTIIEGNFLDDLQSQVASWSWSPDSKWLAIPLPTDRGVNVVLATVDGSRKVTVARLPKGIDSPKFLPNGKGVYFNSVEGDKQLLSIVDLVPADVVFPDDDLDKIDEPRAARPEVKVDVYEPNIENRLRRLVTDTTFGAVASPDSRAIWTNLNGQLVAVPVSGGPSRPVDGVTGTAGNLRLSRDGGKVYFTSGGKLNALILQAGAVAPISFSAQTTINSRVEEKALFDEIWWQFDRFYYDPTHHGKSWKGLKDKFEKILPFTYDRSDFYAMMGEMMEELESSHLGATAPPDPEYPGTGSEAIGFLGVDWDPKGVDKGEYLVSYVFRGSPADHPQTKLNVGDMVVAIDGVILGNGNVPAMPLKGKVNRKVKLTVLRGGKKMDIVIRPTSNAARAGGLYGDWVAQQRELVDKLSNGQLAYLHIQGMDQPSLERFKREIRTLTPGKKGVVIDVRYNGGGSTSHDILGILIKTPWLIRTTRGPFGIKLSENIFRGDSLELPTITLVNTYSYSNAEVWAEGFRKLKRGYIVGERTPGYVIGTGAASLWDGGSIRMPVIGAYAVDGKELENDGRRPDFNVPFDPNAWLQGRDTQLEKAVSEILKQIKG
jgi:tricorn protease